MLPGQLTKTSIKVNRISRINTDYNDFSFIIYGMRHSDTILVEEPSKKKFFEVPSYSIGNYIRLNKAEIDWKRLSNGSLMKLKDNLITEIVPVSNELQYAWITFEYKFHHKYKGHIREIETDVFKLKIIKQGPKRENSETLETEIQIHAYLPVFPLWCKLSKTFNSIEYSLDEMYMKIDKEFYRFPYGNVSTNDGVCMGANRQSFRDVSNIYLHWVTTIFNRDYTPNVRAYQVEIKHKFLPEFIPITYNLSEISVKISAGAYHRLNVIDMYYYLANVDDANALDFMKVFVKLPEKDWRKVYDY